MSIAIRVENLSKAYQIGQIGTGTISKDIERWLITKVLRKEDPFLKIGETNVRDVKGESNIVWSLKDIDFEAKQGEVIGIIGKNGAGKSTLLKLLTRITSPTFGRIKIKGRIASLLEVGTGFHPELTGRENIYLNGSILGMRNKEITRKLDQIIDFSGVERYIDTPVKRYSSGMYVRLAFAVAAHLESEILIVDEVLAVGDAEFQQKCLDKMEEVGQSGRTILFVSHNMSAIRRLCKKALSLKNGRVLNFGEINSVVSDYTISENSQEGITDILERTIVKVNSVNFFVNSVLVDSVASGEDLSIAIDLYCDSSLSGGMNIGLAVETLDNSFAMINYTQFQNVEFDFKSGVYYANIKRLPLSPGKYKLHLRILNDNKEVYWNTYIKVLNVEAGDFFGTGVRGEETLCPWLQEFEWRAS